MKNNKKGIAFFLVKFFALFTILHILLIVVDLSFFQNAIASFQAELLSVPFAGNAVFIGEGNFLITASCTGLVSSIILAAIIFSLKKPGLKQKVLIFLGGTILLLVVNQVRLLFVLFSAKLFGVFFAEIVHVFSWFATTVAIIFAWYYFTKRLTKIDSFEGFL